MLSVTLACHASAKLEENPDVLTVGIPADPHNLDPRIGTDKASYDFHRLIFSGLIQRDKQDRLIPDLAERWVQPDAKTIRFYLRKGVRFHDGRPLTADDVVYTYRSILDGSVKTLKRGAFRDLAEVRRVSRYVVEFRLNRPNSSFLINLTIGIVPHGWSSTRKPNFIGSGPFKLITMTRGEQYVLERNPFYYGPRPKIHRLVLRVVPDMMVRWLELRKGTLDLVMSGWSPDILRHVDQYPHLKAIHRPSSSIAYITYNLRHPVLKNLKVRKALKMAIDRQSLIQAFFLGTARPADSLLFPVHWAYEPSSNDPGYRPKEAMSLLDEAGYPDPDGPGPRPRFSLVYKTSTNPFRLEIAQALQYQLKQVGVALKIQSLEWGTFYHDITHGNFDLYAIVRVGISDPDIFTLVFHSRSFPPQGANRGFYQNPRVDEWLDRARITYDQDLRKKLYAKVQNMLRRDLPAVYLWYEPNIAIMKKSVGGFDFYPNGDYYNLVFVYKRK